MDNRAAFARARRFLNYNLVAKWSALLAAVGSGIFFVGLLVVLGLFADLIVNQGRIPTYDDLSAARQADFVAAWKDLPEEDRQQAIARAHDALLPDEPRLPVDAVWSTLSAEEKSAALKNAGAKEDAIKRLVETDTVQLTVADRHLAASLYAKADPEQLGPPELQYCWRAYVYQLLKVRVDDEAADFYLRHTRLAGPRNASERDDASLGVLSLVVRTQNPVTGALVGWLASWNTWMWDVADQAYYLGGLAMLALVLAVVRSILMFTLGYYAARATIDAATRLRRAIYHHTFRLGTLAFRALGPSEAVSVFTRHLEAMHDAMYTWLTIVFREPVKFALVLIFALVVNFKLAVVFLLCAVLVWLIGGQIAAYFRGQGRIATRRAADQLALIQESLKIMRLVKCYLMELFNQARVERQLSKYAGAQLRRYFGEAIYRPLFVFLGTASVLGLLYLAGLAILGDQVGVASAITLATALVSLYFPLLSWLEQRRFLRRGGDSAAVLFKFLDRSGAIGQVVGAEFLPPLAKSLEFDEVSLQEPGTGRKLLQGVSLTVAAGERVALVGPDDMEKHALVYLIPRFLDPASGEIRIDNKNLRWVTFDSLRTQIAIVLQHNLVFNDSVANNIGCGDPSYTLPQIIEAAKVAHAHQLIQKLPQGYETPIGEMGHSLRVGEQFRIALARAILRDPALLIVEEPVIALDENSKALLDDTFARVLPGRTAIFLPHRLSTIRSCDRIFLLNKGKIEATGDHRELLAHSELYRHLQYMEFNEFAGKQESMSS